MKIPFRRVYNISYSTRRDSDPSSNAIIRVEPKFGPPRYNESWTYAKRCRNRYTVLEPASSRPSLTKNLGRDGLNEMRGLLDIVSA